MKWFRGRNRRGGDRGVTTVEYGLIIAGVAIVAIPGIVLIQNSGTDTYNATLARTRSRRDRGWQPARRSILGHVAGRSARAPQSFVAEQRRSRPIELVGALDDGGSAITNTRSCGRQSCGQLPDSRPHVVHGRSICPTEPTTVHGDGYQRRRTPDAANATCDTDPGRGPVGAVGVRGFGGQWAGGVVVGCAGLVEWQHADGVHADDHRRGGAGTAVVRRGGDLGHDHRLDERRRLLLQPGREQQCG